MNIEILRKSILDIVQLYKLEKHADNPFGHRFSVHYYAVKQGVVLSSETPYVFDDAEWGIVKIGYGKRNYSGTSVIGVNLAIKYYFVWSNKDLSEQIRFGQWEIVGVDYMNALCAKNNNAKIYLGGTERECLEKWLKIYPIIKDCEDQETVNRVLSLAEQTELKTKEDVLDQLIKDNALLKEKLNKIKALIEE